jgi:Domain of unknown function (DUF4386)
MILDSFIFFKYKVKKMNMYRKTAIIVGVLFISATVTSILSSVFLGSTLTAPNYLTSISVYKNPLITAMILQLIAAISAFGTAVFIFPVLKKYVESLAIGYVGFRLIENTFYVIGASSLLVMLTVGQGYVTGTSNASMYQPLGTLLLGLYHWAILIGTLIFAGLGGLTLNYVLFRSKLVPRWLSAWGLIGAGLIVLYGLIGIIGLTTGFSTLSVLALPIAVQEMVFAAWLIIKGFNLETITQMNNCQIK